MRTVTSALRILGLARERRFCRYHRVLSRAVWPPRTASRILLGLLVRTLAPTGPLVFGIDDTVERRRGNGPASSSTRRAAGATGWLRVGRS